MSMSNYPSPAGNVESIAYFILFNVESYLRCPEVSQASCAKTKKDFNNFKNVATFLDKTKFSF